jgi:multidrug efflux pump subunit AcrA (membrane-fusion protein)
VQEKLAVIAAKQYDEKLKQAKDAVAAGEQEIERAKQESARAAELIKVHGVSDAQKKIADIMVKKAEALLEVARAKQREAKLFEPQLEVDRAAAAVAEKTALVEKARLSLEDYQVRAPSAGTVLRALASVGEVVSPGPHGPALEFLPDKKRIIRVEVQQEFAASDARLRLVHAPPARHPRAIPEQRRAHGGVPCRGDRAGVAAAAHRAADARDHQAGRAVSPRGRTWTCPANSWRRSSTPSRPTS